MQALIRVLLRYRNVVLIVFLAMLAIGAYAFLQLDIEAYPDPSPPMVEFITQYPSWSAEEMEQQVTIPMETGSTWYVDLGDDPVAIAALLAGLLAWVLVRHDRSARHHDRWSQRP